MPNLGDLAGANDISGWDLAFAGVSLLIAWIAGRLVRRALLRVLGSVQGVSEDLRQITARIGKYIVWMLGVGVALTFLGAEVQPLLTAAILIALVAGLALRGIATNFAAGIVLQSRRPVQLGDEIESLGFAGVITAMNGSAVVIETYDGRTVHLPNSKVLDNPLVNHVSHSTRRADLEIRVDLVDPERARAIAIAAIAATDGVAGDRAPSIVVTATDPASMTLEARAWYAAGDRAAVSSALIQNLAAAYRGAGIDAAVTAAVAAGPVTPPPPPPPAPSR